MERRKHSFERKRKKTEKQSHSKVPADTLLWALRKIGNWIPAPLSEILGTQEVGLGPVRGQSGTQATYLGFCSGQTAPVSGWVAWDCSLSVGLARLPRQTLTTAGLRGLPLDLVLPCVWGLWWPLGPASHFGLLVSLLGPAGHPWGGMGVGGGPKTVGFFSWWVVGLE